MRLTGETDHAENARASDPAPSGTHRCRAVSLGPGVVASHRSAAYLWGAEIGGAAPVDVIAGRGAGSQRPGVTIHRPLDGGHVRSVVRHGIPVTTPARTLVELGAVCARTSVERVYEQFLVAGTVTSASAQAALVRHARRGRVGAGVLRSVLDGWTLGERPPDSVLEAVMARVLQRHGLPVPRFQHVVRGAGFRYRVDFAYPELRIVIEVDGWRYHAFTRHVRDGPPARRRAAQRRLDRAPLHVAPGLTASGLGGRSDSRHPRRPFRA